MAEEQQDVAQGEKKSNKMVGVLIMGGIVILVPAILALVVFQFILRPMLHSPEATVKEPVEQVEEIPAGTVTIDFPEAQATVLTDDPDSSSPLLIYQVSMACSPDALTLIETNKAWFTAMLNKLHRNRTWSELNDPYIQETILKQAKQEANLLLKKLVPNGKQKIVEVMYLKFVTMDL